MQIFPDHEAMLYSPGNWVVSHNAARSVNAGAYLRFMTSGFVTGDGKVYVQVDISNMPAGTEASILSWRVNGRPWHDVPLTAPVVELYLPDDQCRDFDIHLVEVMLRGTTEGAIRWGRPAATEARIEFISVPDESVILRPSALPRRAIIFGDSITEGFASRSMRGGAVQNDALIGYAHHTMTGLGYEYGIVGFASQGLTKGGSGAVPPFNETLGLVMPGHERDFSSIELIILNHGTNDSGAASETFLPLARSALERLMCLAPHARIVVLRPFWGDHAQDWQRVIAAFHNPAITYVDTSGIYERDNGQPLHPSGAYSGGVIAPQLIPRIEQKLAIGTAAAQFRPGFAGL